MKLLVAVLFVRNQSAIYFLTRSFPKIERTQFHTGRARAILRDIVVKVTLFSYTGVIKNNITFVILRDIMVKVTLFSYTGVAEFCVQVVYSRVARVCKVRCSGTVHSRLSVIHRVQEKRDQNVFCDISYKTRAIVMKFGTQFPE